MLVREGSAYMPPPSSMLRMRSDPYDLLQLLHGYEWSTMLARSA